MQMSVGFLHNSGVNLMKKQYVSPDVSLVCFEANEKLASVFQFDDMLNLPNGLDRVGDGVNPGSGDVNVGNG